MKIDLAGPRQRGLAMGLNEFAGYLAVAAALASDFVAASTRLRPEPFYLGVVFAVAGLALSVGWVRETRGPAALESANAKQTGQLGAGATFAKITLWDRDLPSVTQAGLVNNLNGGMAWGLFPIEYAAAGMDIRDATEIVKDVWEK